MSKRAQLVCQHLENISREALEKHQRIIRAYVRGRQGVYALYRRGKLYYVGLATNLRNRLKHHLKDRHGQSWDRFSGYLTIGDSHLREHESLILRTVRPSGNKQKGKFARCEDLRRRFRRDIKRSVLAEVEDLFGEPRPPRRNREATPMMPAGKPPWRRTFPARSSCGRSSRVGFSERGCAPAARSGLPARSTRRPHWQQRRPASDKDATAGSSGSTSGHRATGSYWTPYGAEGIERELRAACSGPAENGGREPCRTTLHTGKPATYRQSPPRPRHRPS